MKTVRVLLAMILLLAHATPPRACTTTITGKDASADGSVMVSHSDDGLNDPRIIYVPAMEHPEGAMRPVFYDGAALGFKAEWGGSEQFRLVSDARGPAYEKAGIPPSVPLGYIPQVRRTYAYIEGNYAIMNEHQLAIGECTNKAKVHPEPDPKKRLFYSSELSRVALERCKTAREAVLLMGELIETYGYYGTGETLLVADPQEGWVLEMAGYDMDGTGGVWVAQRVPDDGFFVAANQFRIRDIRKDADDMLFSSNLFDIAKEKGWWSPEDGALDWAVVYGDGEFHHPYYSLRRVWRAQSLVAPSLNLPAWVEGADTRAYPFAVTPERKLTVADILAIHRDNYEGTEFDLTKGMAAGPFGNPNRFEGGAEATMDEAGQQAPLQGAFERPLNIYRCVYSYVTQSRATLPDPIGGVVWYAPDRPATSVAMPLYPGSGGIPDSVQTGDILEFNRGSMWMAFNYVANYIMLKYAHMIVDLQAEQKRLESRAFGAQSGIEAKAVAAWEAGEHDRARWILREYTDGNAADVLQSWWRLSEALYVKYNDGYINTAEELAKPVFYPRWWLEAVGFQDGPLTYEKPEPAAE